MTIKEIIEKGIEGGWKPRKPLADDVQYAALNPPYHYITFTSYHPFHDPLFWQAVGRVEGWKYAESRDGEWVQKMHGMIDALADGKTLEEYIETL